MYRLVLYCLLGLLGVAVVFSLFNLIPYRPEAIVFSTLILVLVSLGTNAVFAWFLQAPTNEESVYITALILALIISPVHPSQIAGFPFLIWAGVWAMASKYLFAYRKKHLFNPAAFAVALLALTAGFSASWWVGTVLMLPFVIIAGILITRKVHRADLVLSFFGAALVTVLLTAGSGDPVLRLTRTLLDSAFFFFAFVMLTEPFTTPPTRPLRIAYGALTGFLFAPAIHIGSLYSTPELALLVGNLFAYAVSPKGKYVMWLREKVQSAADTFEFVFAPDRTLSFKPGQYLEWTLAQKRPDNRGIRRYFTIASAPTESDVRLGVKFYPNSSTYKKALQAMKPGEAMVAAQLAGDFVLPKDPKRKIVFIAGGIGVTPFRSMIQFLLDHKEKRPVILLYSNKTKEEIAYADVFARAQEELGIRTVYTLADKDKIPPGWKGRVGMLDAAMIAEEVPDFRERIFFISGPHGMVVGIQKTLRDMGVPKNHIKTDFFPGFA